MRNANRKLLALGAMILGGLGAVKAARADIISGFDDPTGFYFNQLNAGTPASITGDTLTLTTAGQTDQANDAIFKAEVPVSTFTLSFVYQVTAPSNNGNDPADGFTIFFEDDSRGHTAVGGEGRALGYGDFDADGGTPITNSASIQFNISAGAFPFPTYLDGNANHLVGTQYETGGLVPLTTAVGTPTNYLPVLPVNLDNGADAVGDQILITLVYDGSNLTETLDDLTVPADTFSVTYTGVDIAGAVGGPDAWLGFSGGTGGGTSTQTLTDLTFTNVVVPLPAGVGPGLALLAGMGLALVGMRRVVA